MWWLVKWLYNRLPQPLNTIYAYTLGLLSKSFVLLKYTIKLKPMMVISPWINYKKKRGMSFWHDMIDWMGGFPYEFVRYDVLEGYMQSRGFQLIKGSKAASLGCHEMVFLKTKAMS